VPKIEAAIKDAVTRGARREIRRVATPLRRDARRLRQAFRALREEMTALQAVVAPWRRVTPPAPATPMVTDEEAKAARLSPRLIRSLRTRLGLSQAKLARLVGVSAVALAHWETGRSSPSGKHRATVVGLRRLGRREAKRVLAEIPAPKPRGAHRRRRPKRTARQRVGQGRKPATTRRRG
jgi:DNA-binding XRE family transcriptional regulator